MNKTKNTQAVRYYALHEAGLRNGSFFRVRGPKTCAQYINGDFMGNVGTLPDSYAGQPLKEFDRKEAESLIPKCCR
jgi:hypothetical protein